MWVVCGPGVSCTRTLSGELNRSLPCLSWVFFRVRLMSALATGFLTVENGCMSDKTERSEVDMRFRVDLDPARHRSLARLLFASPHPSYPESEATSTADTVIDDEERGDV